MARLIKPGIIGIAVFLLLSFSLPPKKITVWLIGDSTMCLYEPSRSPLTGWGMPFSHFFDSTVVVENHAKGGRSTRTFIGENRWKMVEEGLKEGDYVFIQFGHNDEAKEEKYKDRYTSVADYNVNLVKFITEARAKKAFPVLITPVTRRRFDPDGNVLETHGEYSAAMIEVAKAQNVPLIDLDRKSMELLKQFGEEQSKLLYMDLAPSEHPHYPEGQKDNTHFNEFGARKIASLVLSGIKELNLELVNRVVKPSSKQHL